jgi:hypothetical protein
MRPGAVFLSPLLLFLSLGSLASPRRGAKLAPPKPPVSRVPALAKSLSPLSYFIGQ